MSAPPRFREEERAVRSDAFIGLTLREAQTLAAANGLRIEVLESMIVDAMVDPRRVRVVLTDGVITQAWPDCDQIDSSGGQGNDPPHQAHKGLALQPH